MKLNYKFLLPLLMLLLLICNNLYGDEKMINLPEPKTKGQVSVEEALSKRRSIRNFQNKNLSEEQISQLLWAAQGITSKHGFRTAPSAGAIYPLEIYFISSAGLFRYIPQGHKIEKLKSGDLRDELATAAWGQNFIAVAAISIIIVADYEKIKWRYRDRAVRYADMEAGHIAQNIHLQAVALGLGSVPVGAFQDNAVARLLNLQAKLTPIYIIPVGYIKS